MSRYRTVVALALSGLWTPASTTFCQSQDVSGAVAGLARRYRAVRTVSARFIQVYRSPGMEQAESGVLFMKKPGLMRWEYRDPEAKLFIGDGRNTYLYVPEDRQVQVRAFDTGELHGTPLEFLLGEGDISRDFVASLETEIGPTIEGTLALRLIPRSPQADYDLLVVECDEKNFDLRRLLIREPTGNTSEFILTDVATNVKLDDRKFQFKIPKGVEVIHLEEKE